MAARQPTERETDIQLLDEAVSQPEYAERRGFEVTEYRDEGISGAKDSRPALDRLMKDEAT